MSPSNKSLRNSSHLAAAVPRRQPPSDIRRQALDRNEIVGRLVLQKRCMYCGYESIDGTYRPRCMWCAGVLRTWIRSSTTVQLAIELSLAPPPKDPPLSIHDEFKSNGVEDPRGELSYRKLEQLLMHSLKPTGSRLALSGHVAESAFRQKRPVLWKKNKYGDGALADVMVKIANEKAACGDTKKSLVTGKTWSKIHE